MFLCWEVSGATLDVAVDAPSVVEAKYITPLEGAAHWILICDISADDLPNLYMGFL